MAMMSKRDKPSHFRIVHPEKGVVATGPKSKILSLRKRLQSSYDKRLEIQPITEQESTEESQ